MSNRVRRAYIVASVLAVSPLRHLRAVDDLITRLFDYADREYFSHVRDRYR